MEDKLSEILKKYVSMFINEYGKYLNKEQLMVLKNINYNQIIKVNDFIIPVGIVNYDSIYISRNLLDIPKKQVQNEWINNKNYSGYLKYLNRVGCNTYEYYHHQLMFLVFKLVIGNDSGLINGFVNFEVNNLRRKYNFQAVNLYKREEVISQRIIKVLGRETILKIMFMDMPSAFKYLNDHFGYRYADLYYQLSLLVDNEYHKLKLDDYTGTDGLKNYADDYDKLLYGDAYNCLLEFNINNSL